MGLLAYFALFSLGKRNPYFFRKLSHYRLLKLSSFSFSIFWATFLCSSGNSPIPCYTYYIVGSKAVANPLN